MSKQTSFVESNLASITENLPTLIVAALLFATGLVLAAPSAYSVSTLQGFININNLVQQFIAGILVVVAFVIAFARSRLHFALSTVFAEKGAIAVGATLWTVGMLFVGIGNANGFTPVGIVASLVGYAILLISLVLSGTLGTTVIARK